MSNANFPSPIPLRQFEAAIQADQRVLGMLYTGSLGRGMAGRFSDLDIEMWLTDAAYAEVETRVREILGTLGAIQFLYLRYAGDSSYYTAFLGSDWQPVDLAVHQPTVERPLPPPSQVRLMVAHFVKTSKGTEIRATVLLFLLLSFNGQYVNDSMSQCGSSSRFWK